MALDLFVPAEKVIKAPNTPKTPIFILEKNVAFTDTISPQHQNSSIEDFVNYLKTFPLRYAVIDAHEPFFAK